MFCFDALVLIVWGNQPSDLCFSMEGGRGVVGDALLFFVSSFRCLI